MAWNLHQIAEEKAEREDEVQEWMDHLERAEVKAREADLSEAEFARLVEECPKYHLVDLMEAMAAYARQHPNTPDVYQMLAAKVDDSPFDLRQWLEAIATVEGWLDDLRLRANFDDILGYLECCCMMSSRSPSLPLKEIAQDMLTEHGFDRSSAWKER